MNIEFDISDKASAELFQIFEFFVIEVFQYLIVKLNPIDTEIFFDACVPGVCEKSHPPENQFYFYKTTFFLHEVKFCIN